MESTKIEEDDQFFDAQEDFPFYDCTDSIQSIHATSHSVDVPSPTATLRRRSSSFTSTKDKKLKLYRQRNQHKTDSLEIEPIEVDESTVTSANVDRVTESADSAFQIGENADSVLQTGESVDSGLRIGENADSASRIGESGTSSVLEVIAGLVIKAIGFQFHILFSFIRIPFSILRFFYMLTVDPLRLLKRLRVCVTRKLLTLWHLVFRSISPHLYDWISERRSTWELTLRIAWGLLWAVYVCIVLCGLLLFSIMVSGIFMRFLVKEPLQMKEHLNFDYSKHSPEAYVPVISCDAVDCGLNCEDNPVVGKSTGLRIVPPNHKLQATVSLLLPESNYNRNLGVFQIRIDFLSAGGKNLASLRHPCMLQFKSEALRYLLTFFKIVPLVTGYLSESQNLYVKMRGFTEGVIPTSCLRVVIEQRAEFRPGAGIPEIYNAFLILESELPLFRRMIWYWKKTLFIWITMMSFMTELLFMVICCRPLIIPIRRSRSGSTRNNDRHPAEN
ncbi:hypothetical protein ACFE04_023417 [Oxalis oulophora]